MTCPFCGERIVDKLSCVQYLERARRDWEGYHLECSKRALELATAELCREGIGDCLQMAAWQILAGVAGFNCSRIHLTCDLHLAPALREVSQATAYKYWPVVNVRVHGPRP